MDIDILVLGSGPAGAAAALTLARRGRSVALVERGRGRRREFGEVLPPGARPHLAALGVEHAFDEQRHLQSWHQRSSWGAVELATRDLSFHPHGCALHLNREEFDADLLAAARNSGVQYMGGLRLRGAESKSDQQGWMVELDGWGCVRAGFVVDATGRASAFARHLGISRTRPDRLVAMLAFPAAAARGEPELIVEANPSGWWYTAPLPDGRAVAAFMTDADLVPAGRAAQAAFWAAQLRETAHVQQRLNLTRPQGVSVALAGMESLASVYGHRWLAVGDAAAAFDPLSSLGLAHALESGRLGGLAADAALAGEMRPMQAYARVVQRRSDECDILRRGYYAVEQRWVASPFWARRSNSARGEKPQASQLLRGGMASTGT